MVVVLDYGAGNIGSVLNCLKFVGADAKLSSDPQEIAASDRVVIPGVGSFDYAMDRIRPLAQVLHRKVFEERRPILGICLGMQVLAESSGEGTSPGLGWIPGKVKALSSGEPQLKVPHMGWAEVKVERENPLLKGLAEWRFYFAHSFFLAPTDESSIVGTTEHGGAFASAVKAGNVYGVQFHPEKSHDFGTQLFRNFMEIK